MQTINYLEQAKTFLNQNVQRLALCVVPMALVAVAHANPSFTAPNNNSFTNGCSGGSLTGTLTGAVTPGALGVSLSGNATWSNGGMYLGTCTGQLTWKGGGSGAFIGPNATLASVMQLTPSGNVLINSYTLTVLVNGSQVKQVTCTAVAPPPVPTFRKPGARNQGTTCSGAISIPSQSFGVTGNLNSYEADLVINATFLDSNSASIAISVPANASIDILAPGSASAPALSPVALGVTALLLALSLFRMAGWKPGRQV